MAAEVASILRTSFKLPVKDAWKADDEFFHSFVTVYMKSALMEYFKMDDIGCSPTAHYHSNMSAEEVKAQMYNFIVQMVFKGNHPMESGCVEGN